MSTTRWLIAFLSLALVLGVVLWEWRQKTSPGPLHPIHAAVKKLQGPAGCAECHGGFVQGMAASCATCHQDVQRQIELAKGLHGQIDLKRVTQCGTCHTDHVAGKIEMVTARSFREAGFADPDTFDHGKIGKFELNGRHAELKCDQCHPAAMAGFLGTGQTRFLGLSQSCVSCHNDVHEGSFGGRCASCHGQSLAFKPAATFKHTDEFPLVSGHAGHECIDCHGKSGPTSVAALALKPLPPRSCAECHASPHGAELVALELKRHAESSSSCTDCHHRDDESFLSPVAKMPPELHKLAGFALDPPHDKATCVACHEAIESQKSLGAAPDLRARFKELYPGRVLSACNECHASPHKTGLLQAVAASQNVAEAKTCVICHRETDASFLSPTAKMPSELHRLTGFTLDPPHDKTQCIGCHKVIGTREKLPKGPDLQLRFAQHFPGRSQQACEKCHEDPHCNQFLTSASKGQCAACHANERFVPSEFDLQKHEQTRMPLTGAHRATACNDCHKLQDGVTKYRSTATACVACHADVHLGTFDEPALPKLVNGGSDCARCHTTSNFEDVRWNGKDHLAWTGYVLKGAHAATACAACHLPEKQADEHGRTFGVAPRSCSACHADPHSGQFVRDSVNDCARCHSESLKFTQTTFDHQKDSAFRLDETHVKLECGACHRDASIDANVKLVRYRPLGMRCEDCHEPRGKSEKGDP